MPSDILNLVEPLSPIDAQKKDRVSSADLECKERMPTPDVFYIPYPYPWKRTYCGSEIICESQMKLSESLGSEQTGEDGNVVVKQEPISPGVVPAQEESAQPLDEECIREGSFIWVAREEDEQEPGLRKVVRKVVSFLQQTDAGSVTTTGGVAGSPRSPVDSPLPLADRSCSSPVGRTATEALVRTISGSPSGMKTPDFFAPPEGGLKLGKFSPRAGKRVRDDSEPAVEEPKKRLCFGSEGPGEGGAQA